MWMKALNKYVDEIDKKDVEAILLVGSYAVGNNNKFSDIDVYIIQNNNVKKRKRGNINVDGYLIEYFYNPINKVEDYLKNDRRGHGGAMANMLINGKILYDKNGIIKKLKRKAKYAYKKKNKKDKIKYYAAWCAYDEYLAAEYHNNLQYYLCLKYIIEAYLYNNDYIIPPELKIEKIFKDKEYRKRYNIINFPNNKFNKLVINCFDKECHKNIKELYEYVIKDGNFDINNFENEEKIK